MKLEYLAIHTCVIDVFNTTVVQCKTLGWLSNYFSLKFQQRKSYIDYNTKKKRQVKAWIKGLL